VVELYAPAALGALQFVGIFIGSMAVGLVLGLLAAYIFKSR
jgi:hypothetical protein